MKRIKHNSKYFLLFSLIISLISCKQESITPPTPKPTVVVYTDSILKVSADGVFMRNNKPYRGIGVNYFNAFYRTILNQNDKSYYEGLKYLSDNKIPFVRFTMNGFWPSELKLYQTNKARYYVLLDEFIKTAERYKVGLIPSLFWFYAAVPDLMGEHMNQWGNPNSKTIEFMRTYTAEVITRYKNSPAIWGWEFGNEVNSYLDMLGVVLNPAVPSISTANGTPATRTADDAMTTEIFQVALNEFAAVVKQNDPDRAIFTGNGVPSANSYHRYKFKSWDKDSSTEYTTLLDVQNPASIGTLTTHVYPQHENTYFTNFTPKATLFQFIQESMRSAKELKRPLFIGEYGSPKTLGATEAAKFQELMSAIVDNQVQLSALWVYDFTFQDADWNITQTNSRKYQLDAIINANTQLRVGL